MQEDLPASVCPHKYNEFEMLNCQIWGEGDQSSNSRVLHLDLCKDFFKKLSFFIFISLKIVKCDSRSCLLIFLLFYVTPFWGSILTGKEGGHMQYL